MSDLPNNSNKKTRRKQINSDRQDFNIRLGEYIKEKRERAGITQTQLAEKLYDGQMEAKGVWKLENGLYTPNIYIISEIAKVLNQSISEFLKDFN